MLIRRSLGCLSGSLFALALGAVLMCAIPLVFAPWSYFLGGRLHLVPLWQGRGQIHTRAGDYAVYFWIMPSPPGKLSRAPRFRGGASVCTPSGQRISLRATAVLSGHDGTDTNGQRMSVSMYYRPWNYSLAGRWDRRPELEFEGRWRNPDLVMTDMGSISRSFLPDGSVYRGPARTPPRGEPVEIVFHEIGWSDSLSGCSAGSARATGTGGK